MDTLPRKMRQQIDYSLNAICTLHQTSTGIDFDFVADAVEHTLLHHAEWPIELVNRSREYIKQQIEKIKEK